ncbi:MAG: hypothetical protein AB7W16_15565 [Candidatus Obscuribacterales bacterium]
MIWAALKAIGGAFLGVFTGGTLDKILDTIEHKMDDETKKEEIKAQVTIEWIRAQAALLVGRTWWFQLFFVIPAGMYWAALLFVSAFPFWGWEVQRLPGFAEDIYFAVVGALFVVDGGKALLGRFKK